MKGGRRGAQVRVAVPTTGLCLFSGLEEPNRYLGAPSSMHGGPCWAGRYRGSKIVCLLANPTRSDLVSRAPRGAPAPPAASCAQPEGEGA